MEENTVELIDYLRVIWKRKILIIVVILVCTGVGVVTAVERKRKFRSNPATYEANAVVKIGQKVVLTQPDGVSSPVVYIESPENLVQTIPLEYGIRLNKSLGYQLHIKKVGVLSMLEITLKGPDRGVEKALKEIINMLLEDHREKTRVSLIVYTNYINKLKSDVLMFQDNIDMIEASIGEIKRREEIYRGHMTNAGTAAGKEMRGGDNTAFLNMLYLRIIDKEKDLNMTRERLRNTQYEVIVHQTTIGSFEEYNTEVVGEVKATAVEYVGKSTMNVIIVAGVAGLMMSLFIAFFMQYIEESKRKGKVVSA